MAYIWFQHCGQGVLVIAALTKCMAVQASRGRCPLLCRPAVEGTYLGLGDDWLDKECQRQGWPAFTEWAASEEGRALVDEADSRWRMLLAAQGMVPKALRRFSAQAQALGADLHFWHRQCQAHVCAASEWLRTEVVTSIQMTVSSCAPLHTAQATYHSC